MIKMNVAYVGALYHAKGLYNLDYIISETLDVCNWHVIGWVATPSEFQQRNNVTCYGSYRSICELYDALDYYSIDLVVMPNECAESFSYIMSEIWEYDIPILGTDRGAIESRIRKTHCGWSCNPREMPNMIRRLSDTEILTDYDVVLWRVDNFTVPSYRDWETDRKSTRLNSSHRSLSRMPSSA